MSAHLENSQLKTLPAVAEGSEAANILDAIQHWHDEFQLAGAARRLKLAMILTDARKTMADLQATRANQLMQRLA